MSRTTLSSRQEILKLNPPFICTIVNSTSNIDFNSNLTTDLIISKDNPCLTIKGTAENQKSIIYLGTPFAGTLNIIKTAIIADGGAVSSVGWSRAKLHFCLNNFDNNVNTVSVDDARMTIIPSGYVGIGNTNPMSLLSLNNVPRSIDPFNWSNCPMTIIHPTATSTTLLNDPKPLLHLCRDGVIGGNYAERATFNLCRYEQPTTSPTTGSRTRLDIGLTHENFNNEICVMSLRSDGRVCIGGNIPLGALHIIEPLRTTIGPSDGTIIIDHNNNGGCSSIIFRSAFNRDSDYGYIQYQDTQTVGGAGEAAKLIIGTQNDSDDDILLLPSGGVAINTTSPNGFKLNVNGTTYISNVLTLGSNVSIGGTLSFGDRTPDFLIYLYSNIYGFGINANVLRYNAGPGASHKFYTGTTNTATIGSTGIITATGFAGNVTGDVTGNCSGSSGSCTGNAAGLTSGNKTIDGTLTVSGKIIVGNNNSSPDLQLGSTTGNNLGIATIAGSFSGASAINDLVLRSINKLILQSGGGNTPAIVITSNNNVGIGTTDPCSLLHIKGTNPALTIMAQGSTGATASINLNTFDNSSNPGSCSLIATDTGSYGNTFKINLKTTGLITSSQFTAFYIDNAGKINIGSQAPNNIFQVGDGARLRISNGNTDYSLIGTKDVDNTDNTRIVISGNARGSGLSGCIEYLATTNTGDHIFKTSGQNEKMRISKDGILTISSNISCGGGISLVGANAFYNTTNVTLANTYNTFLSFRGSGIGNDWAYLRNIGGDESIKLALDFHDDVDARFCIRSVESTVNPTDTITEVFTVDNGNVGIGNPAPFYPLCIGSINAVSDGVLVLTKRDSGGAARNFKMGYDASYNFQLGDFGFANNNTNAWEKQLTIAYSTGNVGIGITGQSYKLYVNGNTYINNTLTVANEIVSNSGISKFKYLQVTNPDNSDTHFPYSGNNQNYIRGRLNIDRSQDGLYVGGDVSFNSTLNVAGALITYNKLDFTNGANNYIEGTINLGSGGWQTNSYANIKCSTGSKTYCRMVFENYNPTTTGGFYFTCGGDGTIGVNTLPDNTYSIKTNKACYFTSTTYPSDRRIKTNIIDIDDYSALQQILLIEPKRYEYIDKIIRGNNVVIGFIAQQVKEIIPEAIDIISDIIPNIYKKATFNNSNINFIDDTDLSFIKINDSIKIQLNGENIEYKIQNINTNHIIVDNIIKNSTEIDNLDNNECLVYGTEVHDFHALKKDYIFTMNVCATQELYKLIQNQNIIIEELKNKIERLESRL